MQVLSVDVFSSTDADYSGNNTLTITTNTSFLTTEIYYLLADPGECVCVCVFVYTYKQYTRYQ